MKRVLSHAMVSLLAVGGSVALLAAPAQAADVVFPVELDFSTGTAGDVLATNDDFWVFGTPTFTGSAANKSGAEGVGWLELTESKMAQASALISKRSIPAREGATFEFDFRAFTSGSEQRADGFSFFLIDGDDESFQHTRVGARGAGLGYSSGCDNSLGVNGVEKGYLGVGIDAFGNFSESGDHRHEAPGLKRASAPDSVILRGSGDGGAGTGASGCGQQYLYAAGKKLNSGSLSQGNVTAQNAQFRRARIAVIPQSASGPRIAVSISALTPVGQKPASWEDNVLDYQVNPGDGIFNQLPENLRFGFAASTGGQYMTTQISNLQARTSTDVSLSASAVTSNGVEGVAFPGDSVAYSLTARNHGPAGINAANTPGFSRVYQNLADLGLEDAEWTCVPAGGAVCAGSPVFNGTVLSQDWYGPAGSSVTLNVTARVATDARSGLKSGSAITPTNFEANVIDPSSVSIATGGGVSDTDISNNSARMTLQVRALVSPAASGFVVSTGTRTADGSDSHSLTATVRDADGEPRAGSVVTFTAPSSVTLSSATAVSDQNGVASVFAKSTVAGNYLVGAKIGNEPVTGSPAEIEFVAGSASASESSWTVTPNGPVKADGQEKYTATVLVKDINKNPVAGENVKFVLPEGLTLLPGSLTSDTTGKVTAEFTSTVVGSYPLVAQLGDEQIGSARSLAFMAGPASADRSTISATPEFVEANGKKQATVVVALFDDHGNAVLNAGDIVQIQSSQGDISEVTKLQDGTYSAIVTARSAGQAKFTFSVDGVTSKAEASATFVDTPSAPVLDYTDGTKISGTAESGNTVEIRDKNNELVGTAVADNSGRFTVTPTTKLAVGDEFTAVSIDEHGFKSPVVSEAVRIPSLQLDSARLRSGETQVARGVGYKPGETVTGVLNSTPVDLGSQIADDHGEVVFEFKVPAGIELGTHKVTLESKRSGSVSKSFAVYELAKKAQVVAPKEPTPPVTPTPSTPPTPPVSPVLSVTGSDVTFLLGAGIALLLAGAAALVIRRSRRIRSESDL